jgi:hypothetical protein
MELTGGAHLVVTEGEGVVAGLRQHEKGDVFWPIRHCRAGQDGPSTSVQPAGEKGKGRWLAGRRGRAGQLATGPIWPNVKEKFFSE